MANSLCPSDPDPPPSRRAGDGGRATGSDDAGDGDGPSSAAAGSSSADGGEEGNRDPIDDRVESSILKGETVSFPTPCPNCLRPDAQTAVCVAHVPHLREIILLCLSCDACGYRSREIKDGGGISPRGTEITLHARDVEDLEREVQLSDTAGVRVPELELELESGGGGVCTTVEGLLKRIRNQLRKAVPFETGDGGVSHNSDLSERPSPERLVKYVEFLNKLEDAAEGRRFPFTLIISDPLSGSFVGSRPRRASEGTDNDGEIDDVLRVEEYERSPAQDEALGLNDMRTENYTIRNK